MVRNKFGGRVKEEIFSHPESLIKDLMISRQVNFSQLIEKLPFDTQIKLFEAIYNKGSIYGLESILEERLGVQSDVWSELQRLYNSF